jgi:uncharacterized repeat protein (TIGR04138 family)
MNRVMSDFCRQVVEVARQHRRFNPEAYLFIFHSLKFAQEELGYGGMSEPARPRAAAGPGSAESAGSEAAGASAEASDEGAVERHITGQQLCEAIRQLALREFGYMAKTVFNSWGITQTADFGDMVYHLIEGGLMKKTDRDRREDFANVFDFETGLSQSFRMELPEEEAE